MPVEEQIVSIYAVTEGHMDSIPTENVEVFESALMDYMRTRHGAMLDEIRSTGALPDIDALVSAISDFKDIYEVEE
jgi:F-type H+-transporting ATPase subunit alpha